MAYQATVIPVMIASPGDVSEERDIIRTVIHDWNDVNAASSKVMLTPVGWETHSSPELSGRPQELINSRILRDCDLLVGVFWTRLGTPTGKSQSGTVEEIEEHIAAGKPAMIYFSSKPVAPASINPEQYSEVLTFKERCKTLGLVEEFDDAAQFRTKFAKHLQICLIHNEHLKSLVANKAETPPQTRTEAVKPKNIFQLSEEAKKLLKAAAAIKNDGTILKLAFIGGRQIQAGGQIFGGENGREAAKWESALNELINHNLVVARGYKGETFELTLQGWTLADSLQQGPK